MHFWGLANFLLTSKRDEKNLTSDAPISDLCLWRDLSWAAQVNSEDLWSYTRWKPSPGKERNSAEVWAWVKLPVLTSPVISVYITQRPQHSNIETTRTPQPSDDFNVPFPKITW